MSRVLVVCGSLQRASANRAALDIACGALTASGVVVSAFEGLGSIPPLNPDRSDEPGDAVAAFRAGISAAGSRRFTNLTTIDEIGGLASSLVASVAQRPSERFAAVAKLARDAGVEQGPLADHIAAQDGAWLGG